MGQSFVVDGDQLSRLSRLCRVLASRDGGRLRDLQTRLKTSRRTIFRDLATLAEMGIEIELTDAGYVMSQSLTESRKRMAEHHRKTLDRLLRTCLR